MVTMEDITRTANVSRATVSRVLSNHPSIKMKTHSHVMYWVKKLRYEPNQMTQDLARNRIDIIEVLFPDLSNPLYASLITTIVYKVEIYNYSVILGNAQGDWIREANIISGFKRREVDGIIVRPVGTPNRKLYSGVSIPPVNLFKPMDRKNIIINSEGGGIRAAHHFYELGHRDVGYVRLLRSLIGNNKLKGSRDGLERNGLKIGAIMKCSQHETAENQKAYEIIDQYFESHDPSETTTWLVHSNIAANDAIKVLVKHGINAPKGMIVYGYNSTLLAKKMIPTLISVAFPIEEIVKNAVGLVIQRIEGDLEEEVVSLSPGLIVHGSTSSLL